MERLDILEKIYQYGENLSSEEMNQIVSYINNIIDSMNRLISNNNGVNTGHCEIRYKNSSSQPEKPDTGSSGLADGWSATFSLPNTREGETTWMSLCFITGDGVYGEWSTPVCISWGSVEGQQGQQGDTGEAGAFTSRVFKRQNSKPSTPTGGTYYNPVPEGWYDGVPQGQAIIWSSTCTFYGNGLNTGWSEPAPESDSANLDIEFSPSESQPHKPLGNTPFSNHEQEGWYDPNSPNFNNVGNMIWRAERKVSNGEYDGDWTITRIYGEKGDKGDRGYTGGRYEFRYNNFQSTPQQVAPIKPEAGTEGISGGWRRNQEDLTPQQIKEGMSTWMTQCYLNELGVYGTWTDPIRITGASGTDGEDGSEQEFIYTRNNTGETPPTPPRIQIDDWHGIDPNSGIVWTDDPQGVDDEMMWEFVSTRVKELGVWSNYSTPVIWAKWGKQGRIGQMSYLAGVWNANTTYTKTIERSPVVYYNQNYYYLAGEINSKVPTISSKGDIPTSARYEDDSYVWAQAEKFEMVFTDVLFVNTFAKLASFIISGDWLISRNGTLYDTGGTGHDIDADHSWSSYDVNNAYLEFKPSNPDSNLANTVNFVPAVAIDSLSGRAFFWKGKFKGNVTADSLTLGNGVRIPQGNVKGLTDDLSTINTNLAKKLNSSDVSVEDSDAYGVKRKKIKVGNEIFYAIYQGSGDNEFVITDVGRTGDGNYFKISKKGLLEAHNALIYGTVFATAGQFSGSVNATEFIAGDPGGLNITTTGDAISFNYGGERRAWFTTKDPNGNDTSGMYLYLRNPNGGIITIDFANLTFKSTTVTGVADQQTTIYQNLTDTNYVANIFVNSENGLYYSNSNLNSSYIIYNGQYYEKVKEGFSVITYDSKNRLYRTEFYQKISIVNGVKTVISSNYYATATIFGTKRMLKGTTTSAVQQEYNVYNEDTNGKISDNPYMTLTSESIYTATTTTNSFGGTITNLMGVNRTGGVTFSKKEDLTMCSS